MILAHVVDHCKPAKQTLTSNRFYKRRINIIFDTWSTWHQYQKRRIKKAFCRKTELEAKMIGGSVLAHGPRSAEDKLADCLLSPPNTTWLEKLVLFLGGKFFNSRSHDWPFPPPKFQTEKNKRGDIFIFSSFPIHASVCFGRILLNCVLSGIFTFEPRSAPFGYFVWQGSSRSLWSLEWPSCACCYQLARASD